MLTYDFSNLNHESLYAHLYRCIREDITAGILTSETKLPSKRMLAAHLGLSTITVENAFAQLIAEGYIYSIPKKGYYVADLGKKSYAAEKNAPPAAADTSEQKYFADFSSNKTSSDAFPFAQWARIMREVLRNQQEALLATSPGIGIPELRQVIAEHLNAFRGMSVSAEQIIVGAGTEYLYSLIIQLLGRDLIFAVEDPGYNKLTKIYEKNSVTHCFLPLDHCGLDMNALENSSADVLHISPSHHFPTGTVTTASRRYELLGWAARDPNRYIIEDDYDCEFRMKGRPVPPLQSMDVMGKVIYLNTFTRSLSSTIRISYMVLPPALMERFRQSLSFYACTVSNFEQYTLANFIRGGFFQRHLNRIRSRYRTQREMLLQAISESPLADKSQVLSADAGLHFLLDIDTTYSDAEICVRGEAEGLKLSFLSQYAQESAHAREHVLVINDSAIPEGNIAEAVIRLSRCCLGD